MVPGGPNMLKMARQVFLALAPIPSGPSSFPAAPVLAIPSGWTPSAGPDGMALKRHPKVVPGVSRTHLGIQTDKCSPNLPHSRCKAAPNDPIWGANGHCSDPKCIQRGRKKHLEARPLKCDEKEMNMDPQNLNNLNMAAEGIKNH